MYRICPCFLQLILSTGLTLALTLLQGVVNSFSRKSSFFKWPENENTYSNSVINYYQSKLPISYKNIPSCFENIVIINYNLYLFNRICVEAALPPNVALQIDCYCNKSLPDRQTMHVQGLSHWAPANIGPYSQCVQVREMILSILVWEINSVKIWVGEMIQSKIQLVLKWDGILIW